MAERGRPIEVYEQDPAVVQSAQSALDASASEADSESTGSPLPPPVQRYSEMERAAALSAAAQEKLSAPSGGDEKDTDAELPPPAAGSGADVISSARSDSNLRRGIGSVRNLSRMLSSRDIAQPNCCIGLDPQTHQLQIRASRAIKSGEAIKFDMDQLDAFEAQHRVNAVRGRNIDLLRAKTGASSLSDVVTLARTISEPVVLVRKDSSVLRRPQVNRMVAYHKPPTAHEKKLSSSVRSNGVFADRAHAAKVLCVALCCLAALLSLLLWEGVGAEESDAAHPIFLHEAATEAENIFSLVVNATDPLYLALQGADDIGPDVVDVRIAFQRAAEGEDVAVSYNIAERRGGTFHECFQRRTQELDAEEEVELTHTFDSDSGAVRGACTFRNAKDHFLMLSAQTRSHSALAAAADAANAANAANAEIAEIAGIAGIAEIAGSAANAEIAGSAGGAGGAESAAHTANAAAAALSASPLSSGPVSLGPTLSVGGVGEAVVLREPAFARNRVLIAAILMVAVYAGIVSDVVHRTLVALIGSFVALMLLAALGEPPSLALVIEWMDEGTLALLFGMMILVHELSLTGLFQWCAVRALALSGGELRRLLVFLCAITALLSAFLDNVTTMLLLAPVTIELAGVLEVSPVPYLICEALFSNIGGAATMIGDPPNIIIGNMLRGEPGIDFEGFIVNVAPATLLASPPAMALMLYWFRKEVRGRKAVDLQSLRERYPIKNPRLLMKVGLIIGTVVLLFFLHPVHEVDTAWIALAGAVGVLLACAPHDLHESLVHVEWDTLIFFAALFVLIEAVNALGLIGAIGSIVGTVIEAAPQDARLAVAMTVIVWVSALTSAVLDNIPFTATMVPVVRILAEDDKLGLPLGPLVWALSLGACLGGNGTLVGASANLVTAGIAEHEGHTLHFSTFSTIGMLTVFISCSIANLYLLVVFEWS